MPRTTTPSNRRYHAKDESIAAEIEDDFALLIADLATEILKQVIEVVVVLPKVFQ